MVEDQVAVAVQAVAVDQVDLAVAVVLAVKEDKVDQVDKEVIMVLKDIKDSLDQVVQVEDGIT